MKSELLEMAEAEKSNLERFKRFLMKNFKNAPKGILHVKCSKKKYYQYYLVKDGKETYIKTNERYIAKSLAQRDYILDLLELVEERLRVLQKLVNCYEKGNLEDYPNKLSPGRRALIDLVIPDDEAFIQQWKNKFKTGENTYPIKSPSTTNNDEIVRSKSEKIIADRLADFGIPYVYEPTLILKDGSKIFPDFAVLNVKRRKSYYFEHFGMMDLLDYCESTITKLDEFSKNGYYFGKNLLYTLETKDKLINVHTLDRLIKEYLL